MANYEHPSDDTIKAIDDVMITKIEERLGVKFNIIVNNDQKEIIKVKKYSADTVFLFGYDLQVSINEVILDGLPPVEQNLCIQEQLGGISFNFDRDMVSVTKGDFTAHSGFVDKHSWEKVRTLRESVKSLYDKKKEDDAQNKA